MTGIICMWSGAIVDIPNGWALCDGTQGTPDLRNRFIVGAGDTYPVGDAAGTLIHAHSGDVDYETDSVYDYTSVESDDLESGYEVDAYGGYEMYEPWTYGHAHLLDTETTGHSHSFITDDGGELPPYYALAYIMKL